MMKFSYSLYFSLLLSLGTLHGMQQAGSASTTFDYTEIWKQYQELSQLTEVQQKALIALAQKSNTQETEDLLLAAQAVEKSSSELLAWLATAKETRAATGARILRAFWLGGSDVHIIAALQDLSAEQILEKLYAVSTIDEQTIGAMKAQAPQAPTKDLTELINRFEKIQSELTKFIELIVTMKADRVKAHQDAEKESADKVEALKKESAQPVQVGSSCIIA